MVLRKNINIFVSLIVERMYWLVAGMSCDVEI